MQRAGVSLVLAGALCAGLLPAGAARATRPEVHTVAGYGDLAGGELEGTAVDGRGFVHLGVDHDEWVGDLPGPVLALTRAGDGKLYVATAAPGRVWRVTKGSDPELIADLKKPLVTALLPIGRGSLVALSAPDGGAHLIQLASGKAPTVVEAKDVKMLLGGAVYEDRVYAVGGGDEGVLLRWRVGDKAFERLATVKEKHLRSVAVQKARKGARVVVGGGDEGVVYDWENGRLRALVDSKASEVTALALGRDGRVFAAIVDTDKKLSDGATDRDEEEDEDDEEEDKPRKVKSSEVLSIAPNGRVDVLWQSKSHGAYALALTDKDSRLLLGTGASGRVYDVDPKGRRRASIVLRTDGHDEVTVVVPDRAGVLLGTAHPGGVVALGRTARPRGVYLSKVLDSKSIARYGAASVDATLPAGARVLVSVRTGNTDEPDDTWSRFAKPVVSEGVLAVERGRYAQLRLELERGTKGEPIVRGARIAYLEDNRPPEIAKIQVLHPGWRVVATERDPSDSRSVTFGSSPFKRYLEESGSQLPTMDDRPSGKQKWTPGWRTIYAYVEDPDKDALRYRWSLGRVAPDGRVPTWREVKDWSDEPFYSYEAARMADGEYRMRVEVDDAPTNGPARALADDGESPTFKVAHARPKFITASATKVKNGFRVRLQVRAELPLAGVRCSAGAEDWIPVDSIDGIVDTTTESFDARVEGPDVFSSVSCEAMDEAGNHARIDLPVK